MSAAPGLSILVVNWNSGPALAGCLKSLAAHPPAQPWEVVIVDNGSTDDSVAGALAVLPTAVVIENEANRGLAAANNQAIGAARGEWLLICNPDVEFFAGAIDAMVSAMARHPRAAFVVPKLLHPDGTVHTSAGDLPTLGDALRGRQSERRWGSAEAKGFWWDGWDHATERRIGRGHEATYLVRRVALFDIGLQDERFRLDWEGIDWSERVRAAGWEIWFCPDAEVVHLGGVSIRQVPLRWIASSHLGMYRYFAKRKPAWWRPLLAGAFGGRALAKAILAATGHASYERGQRGGVR